jgi:hypothetical protein
MQVLYLQFLDLPSGSASQQPRRPLQGSRLQHGDGAKFRNVGWLERDDNRDGREWTVRRVGQGVARALRLGSQKKDPPQPAIGADGGLRRVEHRYQNAFV